MRSVRARAASLHESGIGRERLSVVTMVSDDAELIWQVLMGLGNSLTLSCLHVYKQLRRVMYSVVSVTRR